MKINKKYTGFSDASWELNPLQEQFVPFTKRLDCNIIVSAPTASGKAHPITQMVATPKGPRAIGDLNVGDSIFGVNGEITTVTGVFPQGVKPVFDVTFDDGQIVKCCKEHLWAVQTREDRVGKSKTRQNKWRVLETSELLGNLKISYGTSNYRQYTVPTVGALQYDKKDLPILPYLLGLVIGDGSVGQKGYAVAVVTADEEIVTYLKDVAKSTNGFLRRSGKYTYKLSYAKPGVTAEDIAIKCGCSRELVYRTLGNQNFKVTTEGGKRRRARILEAAAEMGYQGARVNPMAAKLQSTGVAGCLAHTKFIPQMYLQSSVADRLELLAGLIDSDGYVDKLGNVSYSTVSRQLAQDVQTLVRQLGGRAKIRSRQGKYTKNGKRFETRGSYDVVISMPADMLPSISKLSRKRDRLKPHRKCCLSRFIESIEPAGTAECVCISVQAADKLYVVGDSVATHNTAAICMRAYPTLKRGYKVIYFAIMRALADQKYDEFTSPQHPWFRDYNFACITGDVAWTPQQFAAVERADVVCITPESFLSIIKSGDERKTAWLKKVRLAAMDEVHLVGQDGRGAAYETAVAELSRICPKAKLLGVSATIPNCGDFVDWFSNLNGRDTALVKSDYRSVPVERKYYSFYSEEHRMKLLLEINQAYQGEQQMFCVWSKAYGNKLKEKIAGTGSWCEFHNGNLPKTERKRIEAAFSNRNLNYLISTSTLTTGVNLPATHLIATHCNAGGKPIPYYELMQALGRTGRPGYDEIGYQHILVPSEEYDYHVERLEKGEPIISTMVSYTALAAHFVQAVYKEAISTRDEFRIWFERTLAYVQLRQSKHKLVDLIPERCLDDMVKTRMVSYDDESGEIKIRRRGIICAQLMLDPYDFDAMLGNFRKAATKGDINMAQFIKAYTYIPSHEGSTVDSRTYRGVMEDYPKLSDYTQLIGSNYKGVAIVLAMRMLGYRVPGALTSIDFQVMDNVNRFGEGVLRAAQEGKEFPIDPYKFSKLIYQAKNRCDAKNALMRIGNLNASEIRGLMRYNMSSINDLKKNPHLVKEIAGSIKRARELRLV